MLEKAGIHLEDLTGCKNWAMMAILKISLLDKWTNEAEKANRLSLLELIKRGREIEDHLREMIHADNRSLSKSSLRDTSNAEVTKIFALSAMTYLPVVISGPYPELPEIRNCVTETVNAFQNLTDPKLLRHLVWPFCITGCLALDGQYDVFRDLLSAADCNIDHAINCRNVL
jgi:hypothetical protein